MFLSRVLLLLDKVTNYFFGSKEGGRRGWLASPLGIGAVFLLPFAVVLAVFILWIANTGESEFDLCVDEVNHRVNDVARNPNVVNSGRQTIINAWTLVLDQVNTCSRLRPNDPELAAIRREAQGILDHYNQIVRREADVIISLPEASLTRIVAQGQNLYVLDSANIQVYQITVTVDGMQATRYVPIRDMRRNGIVGGIPVGDIFDIAYNYEKNRIVAVDTEGVVVECSPQFLQCNGQRLLGTENWVNPVEITIWNSRVYLLDTGVGYGQIWRYDPSGDTYSNAPIEYFGGASAPVITNAIDFDIDDNGSVYVLLAEGVMGKYLGGRPVAFQFNLFPEGQNLINPLSMFLDDRPTSQNIYIVDRYRRTIYETSLIGNFRNSYRVFDENLFDLLSAVVVNPMGTGHELIYATSGNTVFVLVRE